MYKNWLQTSRSLFFSVVLHIVLGGILIFSFKFSTKPTPVHKPTTNIVNAVSVDKKQVELELKRLKDIEKAKKADEKKRQKKLEKKADDAKKKRIAEEKKLKNLKKKKEAEKKKRKEEEKKLKKLEKERKELEKKKKLDKEKKKKEAERKRKEDEKKLKEKALQEELEAEQLQYDQSEISKYTSLIVSEIESKFNETNLKEGLSCKILIRMSEDGTVLESNIVESSGNELFDQRADKAVHSASPLPVPSEIRLFNKMRTIRITFEP